MCIFVKEKVTVRVINNLQKEGLIQVFILFYIIIIIVIKTYNFFNHGKEYIAKIRKDFP